MEQQPSELGLVLPMEHCSAFAVSLPTRKARWVAQALAYAVEELTAENVEELHLALGDEMDDGRVRVIAIQRHLLARWLHDLQALGLVVGAIHVDADMLPRDGSHVLFMGDRALLGGDSEARLVFASGDWPELAPMCPVPVHGHGTLASAPEPLHDYQRLDDPYRFLAGGRGVALNLAQGEFAVRRDSGGLARWTSLALVAALVLLVQLGFNLFQAWSLERAANEYAEASRQLYSELFPEDLRIVNLRAQFDAHLAQAGGGGGAFLGMLDAVAQALEEELPVTIDQIEYSQARGDLALQVRASDFAVLEQLRQRLADGGQPVQMGSASRDSDGVSARVLLGGQP